MAPSGKKQSTRGSLVELVMIVAVALGLALGIQAFLVKPFRIPSESMVPTLEVDQRVLVDRVSYRFSSPDRGDVVVFKPPKGADQSSCGVPHSNESPCPQGTRAKSETNFIKRVVAVGRDRLKVIDGRVYINEKRQRERYIRPSKDCDICDLPEEITVPKGRYCVMGDKRGSSDASRKWGPIPEKWIIGQGFATYWPPSKIGGL